MYDGENGELSSPIFVGLTLGGDGEDTIKNGSLEGESDQWWTAWRKRLRAIERGRKVRKRRRLVENDGGEGDVEDGGDGMDDDMSVSLDKPQVLEEIHINEQTMHEDMRILIKVCFYTFPVSHFIYFVADGFDHAVARYHCWIYEARRSV